MGVAKHTVLVLGGAGAAELGNAVHFAVTVVDTAVARLGARRPGTPGFDFDAVNRARMGVASHLVGGRAAGHAAESGLGEGAGPGLEAAAARLVASAEGRPGVLDAVGGAGLLVARLGHLALRASLAAVQWLDELASALLGATSARLGARRVGGPVVDFAVDGAREGVTAALLRTLR